MLLFLFLSSLYCLWLADRRWHPEPEGEGMPVPEAKGGGWWWVALSALLMGLCFLTRYSSAFLFLPVLVYAIRVCRGRGPVRGTLLYTGIFVAVISPWLARNYQLSGSLLGVAGYEFASGIPYSEYHPNFQHAYDMAPLGHRWLIQSREFFFTSLKQPGMDFLIFFFVVGLLYSFEKPAEMRLRRVVWVGMLCAIAGLACITNNPDGLTGREAEIRGGNLLVLFVPLVVVYGTEFFYVLLDRISFPARLLRVGAIWLFGLVNVGPLIYTLMPPRRGPFPYPPYCAYYTVLAANWFNQDEIGASDMPWAMAWVGNRRTLWLPVTIEEFTEIHDFDTPKGVSFLLLTPFLLNRSLQSDLAKGEYKSWAPVARGAVPNNFPLKIATPFPPNGEQILYCDAPRWTGKKAPEPPVQKKTRPTQAPTVNPSP
jgi:4-amino-4-deoxy-L-arabinose transferase-like glycosyltransferase